MVGIAFEPPLAVAPRRPHPRPVHGPGARGRSAIGEAIGATAGALLATGLVIF